MWTTSTFGRSPSESACSNGGCGARWNSIAIVVSRRGEPLARADVEGRVRPAPVVDVQLGRDVGLGHRVRVDAGLLAVAGHLLAFDVAAPVLAADDVLRSRGVQRAEHLHLLVPDRVGREVDRRLHRGQRDELEQVVLEDVTDCAGLFVERGATLDAERLGDGDLDVVDELAIPDRLEDPVREAEREQVLDRLLAEVVVDPEDLRLVEVLRAARRSAPAPSRGRGRTASRRRRASSRRWSGACRASARATGSASGGTAR